MDRTLEAPSDEELANRAVQDSAAFGLLYDRFATRIYRYCLRRLGDRQDAEDATSAIFMRSLERIGSFRGDSFAGWLFAIARSVVADRFRRSAGVAANLTESWIDPAPGPEVCAIDSLGDEFVFETLRALPNDQREVVELRLSGLSGLEIAQAMNRSVPAIKMLHLRAMKRLRAEFTSTKREEL